MANCDVTLVSGRWIQTKRNVCVHIHTHTHTLVHVETFNKLLQRELDYNEARRISTLDVSHSTSDYRDTELNFTKVRKRARAPRERREQFIFPVQLIGTILGRLFSLITGVAS